MRATNCVGVSASHDASYALRRANALGDVNALAFVVVVVGVVRCMGQ